MCFSANASFSAGAVLTIIGIVTMNKTNQKKQLLFATIPFIFGIQQLSEGMLWITLPKPAFTIIQHNATVTFLFFAQIVWPLLVPISILVLEKKEKRIIAQKVLVGIGGVVCIYLAYCLLTMKVSSRIEGQHILYLQNYPSSLKNGSIVLYALATIVPPFFSSIKGMWLLGTTILISYIISAIFYEHYILSVWCFFSSIISLSVYYVVKGMVDKSTPKLLLKQ